MSFNGKVVLVTGGSSGIGAATATLFAKEGASVAIVGRNEEKLKKVSEEISKIGKPPLIIKVDLANEDEAKTVVKTTIDKFGKLDVLVNNAGIVRYAKVYAENLLQVFDEVINTNLRTAVLLTNLAAPHLIETKGNIVNISSIAGKSTVGAIAVNGYASYCTSKAGLDHFSRVAALELGEKGVRVNTVSPGPVETDIVKNAGMDANWELSKKYTVLNLLPLAEEVGDLVLFLASDKARNITGSDFTIDSGTILKM